MKLLDPREQKFVLAKLKGASNGQAAIQAGYSPNAARNQGYVLMQRPHIREALGITLDQLGITFDKAATVIKEGLEATKTVAHKRWVKGENGDLYEDMYVETEPDHSTRLKAAGMALKLIADENTSQTQKGNVAQYQLTDESSRTVDLSNMDEVELQRAVFRKLDN